MSKRLLTYTMLLLAFALGTTTAASALTLLPAPEVDPSVAIGAVTMLAGTLAVLRARRKK